MMRMRVRVRTLMVVVALIALLAGAWGTWTRRQFCLAQAERCDAYRDGFLASVRLFERGAERSRAECAEFRVKRAEVAASTDRTPAQREARLRELDGLIDREQKSAAESERYRAQSQASSEAYARMALRYRRVARQPWLAIPRNLPVP